MNRLFSSELKRLFNDKVFWLLAAAMLVDQVYAKLCELGGFEKSSAVDAEEKKDW